MDVPTDLLTEMSAPDAGMRRVPMSWEEYLALPGELFAEWVDGEAVVSPRPAAVHARVVARVTILLGAYLADLDLLTEGGIWLSGNRLRGPDVMVAREPVTTTFAEAPPLLVVEVLSRSTRAEDTLRKAPEYAAAGVGQLWHVDPETRVIDVYTNHEGSWTTLLRLDDEHPTGEVVVGDHGVVPLDLVTILRP